MPAEVWTVGQLARRTGLSVRTLHHYDALGLLSPAHRSSAGYRLYASADVARLQQIRSLRELGFSLEEIRSLLDKSAVSPRRVVELHLQQLQEQMARQAVLCRRLQSIATRLSAAEDVSADEFLETIEEMTLMDRMNTYYTPEQLETLERRRQDLGEEEIKRVERAWPELIAQVRSEMERGTDPNDGRVQALARQWQSLLERFTGGDPGMEQSLRTMYAHEPDANRQTGLDPAVFAYIGKAMKAASNT